MNRAEKTAVAYMILIPGTTTTKPHLKLAPFRRTREQIQAEFAYRGMSISEWAAANNFPVKLVYEILSGRGNRQCARGQSHKIAVSLGLKAGVIADSIRTAL